MFQGRSCTPLIPFPELHCNHLRLTTAKLTPLKHTCQSTCFKSLQTGTTWKLTARPNCKPMDDPVCSQLIHFCYNGWPEWHKVKEELLRYWPTRADLSVCEGLLLHSTCIDAPNELQHQTLCKIHHGHQGIERCRLRVTTSVWWSGVSSQMETFVRQCSTCAQLHPPTKEYCFLQH